MSNSNSRLVYSTDGGRVRAPADETPRTSKQDRARGPGELPPDPGDGIVRLHRGKSVRGGKPGTLVVGLPGNDSQLDQILKLCKRRIGTGGTRRGRVLLIQGEHREKLRALLEEAGHTVKLAGG